MCTGPITVSFLLDMDVDTPNTKILKPKNIQVYKCTLLVESDVRHKPTPRQYTVYSVRVRYNREKHSGQKSHYDFFLLLSVMFRDCGVERHIQRYRFPETHSDSF